MQAFQIEEQIWKRKCYNTLTDFLPRQLLRSFLIHSCTEKVRGGKYVPSVIKNLNQSIPCMLSFLKGGKKPKIPLLCFYCFVSAKSSKADRVLIFVLSALTLLTHQD